MTAQRLALAVCLGILSLGAVGCERERPFERAGEKMDEAAEKARDAVEDAGDRVDK